MYSKNTWLATAAVWILVTGCSSVPWKNQPVGNEINLSITFRNNLLFLPSVSVNGHSGRFLLGSSTPVTVLDNGFAGRVAAVAPFTLQLGEKTSFRVTPALLDLEGAADGIVGSDAWRNGAVSIDYRSGLVTYQKEGIHPELMTIFPYQGEPSITVDVDGKPLPAVVDTSSPDTLLLPRRTTGRGRADIAVAGTRFGSVDVGYRDIAKARIGNRLLSRFLVSIDYRQRVVGLFRDPRIAL